MHIEDRSRHVGRERLAMHLRAFLAANLDAPFFGIASRLSLQAIHSVSVRGCIWRHVTPGIFLSKQLASNLGIKSCQSTCIKPVGNLQ